MIPWLAGKELSKFDQGYRLGYMDATAPTWWAGYGWGQLLGAWDAWARQLAAGRTR